ncbi:hypothetical protein GUJ93_ZPchr0004g40022 [Zizania palustris]|uniref:Uncharacterized protein n=1 Tax=Zizania palustris TaxID=103762 RepID=A0A8J5S7K8_ZIZPA|nr:hypothetical protein GUJ93_ZPchr0004g40022 [Zizania palustris]
MPNALAYLVDAVMEMAEGGLVSGYTLTLMGHFLANRATEPSASRLGSLNGDTGRNQVAMAIPSNSGPETVRRSGDQPTNRNLHIKEKYNRVKLGTFTELGVQMICFCGQQWRPTPSSLQQVNMPVQMQPLCRVDFVSEMRQLCSRADE